MNFQQIRFVIAIAETGSFTRAAEKCFVTQPALSNAIGQLEDELGARIFQRSRGKSLALTDFGELLIVDMQAILSTREKIFSSAADYLARDGKTVRLGVSPLISDDYVSSFLRRLKGHDAEINIIITQMNKADIEPALLNGTIDFGLAPKPLDSENYKSIEIYSEPLLYLAKDPGPGNAVKTHDLAHETFLHVQDDCGLAGTVRLLLRDFQITHQEYEGRALGYNVLETWVQLGLGVTLLPASKVQKLSLARRIDDNNGAFVSIGFEACWLESQEQRACFPMIHEELSIAA